MNHARESRSIDSAQDEGKMVVKNLCIQLIESEFGAGHCEGV